MRTGYTSSAVTPGIVTSNRPWHVSFGAASNVACGHRSAKTARASLSYTSSWKGSAALASPIGRRLGAGVSFRLARFSESVVGIDVDAADDPRGVERDLGRFVQPRHRHAPAVRGHDLHGRHERLGSSDGPRVDRWSAVAVPVVG